VGNRIAGGKFKLDGKEYTLTKKTAPNAARRRQAQFDKVIWNGMPSGNARRNI